MKKWQTMFAVPSGILLIVPFFNISEFISFLLRNKSIHIVIRCLARSAIVLGRFGPAVAAEASSQVLQRPSPIGGRFALFLLINGF